MTSNRRTSEAELVPNRPLLLTLPELAAHLRVDRATVYRLLQRHELPIPVLRLGRSPRVRSVDVEKYLAELAAEVQDEPALSRHSSRHTPVSRRLPSP
jgi:excisionase family DNA binding protein